MDLRKVRETILTTDEWKKRALRVLVPGAGVDDHELGEALKKPSRRSETEATERQARNAAVRKRFTERIWEAAGGLLLGGVFLFVGLYNDGNDLATIAGALLLLYGAWRLMSALSVLTTRVSGTAYRSPEKLVEAFYGEIEWDHPDWGRMHALLAPYSAEKVPLAELAAAWTSGGQTGNLLRQQIRTAVEQHLSQIQTSVRCVACGDTRRAYHTLYPWKFNDKKGTPPSYFVKCGKCSAIYCQRCSGHVGDDSKCPSCGKKLLGKPQYYYFEETPEFLLGRVPPTSHERNLGACEVVERPSQQVAKVIHTQRYVCVWDAPMTWSALGKPDESIGCWYDQPFSVYVSLSITAVRLEDQWWILEPFPGVVQHASWITPPAKYG